MRWIHEGLVDRAVRDFCARQVPDAHGLDGLVYSVDALDGTDGEPSTVFRVSIDIPTSTYDAWLTLLVVEGKSGATVERLHCVRSGRGDHEGETYVWDSESSEWETVPEE